MNKLPAFDFELFHSIVGEKEYLVLNIKDLGTLESRFERSSLAE